ncbi:MAG: hypothetical protein WCC04_01940 [Terriglobales bacterium]
MLPTNFGTLADENSELRPVFLSLKEWVEKHADWSVLNPKILAHDLHEVDPFLLSVALFELVRIGLYRRVYMVETPSGVLADGEYDDPRKIPDRVPDRSYNYFDPTETEIVPVFKPVR